MRCLKILFVQLGFDKRYPDVSTLATTYNDGIYYVASFVQQQLPSAQIDMCQMLWGEDPAAYPIDTYDYIMVSALATHFWSNLPTMEFLKNSKSPQCPLIMGGPHAAFAPYEALEYADFVILGEGEIPAVQLITCLEMGGHLEDVENLCYIGEKGLLVFNKFTRYGDIGNMINPVLLKSAPRLHWATVSMSRGCPFDCSFCYAIRILGRKFRTKSIENIRQELDSIYRQTGCLRFYVTDLNFTTRKDFCYAVADAVRDSGYQFIAMSRVEIADSLDLLLTLKKAGFGEYCLGVESENPGVLNTFNKRYDAEKQTSRLLTFAEHDIFTHSAIIFGLESQDKSAMERTAHWCAEARLVHPTFVCLAEYPFQNLLFGSRQDIEDHRILMHVPTYQHYSFVGIFPRHMRPSQLQSTISSCYDIFFKRAFEIESRPQRRMRLKAYQRSVALGKKGMETHIQFLEALEKPYYTPSGQLKEDLLKADFDAKHGHLREWLGKSIKRDAQFLMDFRK